MRVFTPQEIEARLREAEGVARLSGTCTRANVGAVLLGPDGEFVAYGVNQDRAGGLRCDRGQCKRGLLSYAQLPPDAPYENCVYEHAEMVALEAAGLLRPEQAVAGVLRGHTLFVTHKPCHQCRPVLDGLGVTVFFDDPTGVLAL